MPKRIVIFADGTGNAFTTQESNVWRLYQALDKAHPDQIAYYIKGVGTSSVKVVSVLDAATGLGVPSNVRELYRFLCRNWEPKDEIFMFGFSRGAFTIRTLIGLIDDQGLVPNTLYGETVTHEEMTRNVNNAWRRYREKTAPWHETLPTIWMGRWLRDAFLTVKDICIYRTRYLKFRYEEIGRYSRNPVPITFAGLFDTVEAYGVPIEELRKAIDVAVWPISFNNRQLAGNVWCARHALSLDDERITFHPLRFDRSEEETEDRIKEVWFAGVHSDVGGGYPDCELALVPCVWMAEEARAKGLRFKEDAIEDIRADSSALGPRHDSRKGASAFYRYAPRPLETSAHEGGIPVIHHSVAERMVDGADNYAPLTLPHTAQVLMPNGQTLQMHGFKRTDVAFDRTQASADLARHMDVAIAAVEQLKDPDPVLVAHTLATVSVRRFAYFAMLIAAAVALAWPWIVESVDTGTDKLLNLLPFGAYLDAGYFWADYAIAAVLDAIRNALAGVIPAYVKYWTDSLADHPILTIALALIIAAVWRWGGALGDRVNDRARTAWGLSTHAPRREIISGLRLKVSGINGKRPVRWIRRMVNAYVMPAIVILGVGGALAVVAARFAFTAATGVGLICKAPDKTPAQPAESNAAYAPRIFDTADPCWWSGFKVEKGRTYVLGIEMQDRWFDHTIFASPYGFAKTDEGFWLFALARRWPSADWFQPAIKIGSQDTYEQLLVPLDGRSPDSEPTRTGVAVSQLGRFDSISKLAPDQIKLANAQWDKRLPPLRTRFVAEFTADNDGDLFLYVNDAVNLSWVGGYGLFYRNNSGTAAVWLQQKPLPAMPPEPPKR